MADISYEAVVRPSNPDTTVFTFGDQELSDVTFIVDGKEFKCHKMTLACRSTYFKAMFFSNFREKDQDKVKIEADSVAFHRLMEMIYLGEFSDWREILLCGEHRNCSTCKNSTSGGDDERCFSVSTLWLSVSSLLSLADQWDVLKYAVTVLENYFIRSLKCKCQGRECPRSGAKLLIALIYGMNSFKELSRDKVRLMTAAIPVIKKIHPDLRFDADHLEWVLNQNPPSKEKGSSIVEPEEPDTSDVKPLIHAFGDENVSDVTFVVGGEEFKCHKMFLAARSAHFQEMLFPSSTKINPDIVHLDEDPVVFSQLMSILYFGNFLEYRAIINCYKRGKAADKLPCSLVPKLWKAYSSLIKLAEKLGVRDHVIAAFDRCFMCNWQDDRRRQLCTCVGAKFIFAAVYGLHEYTSNVMVSSRKIGAGAFSVIKKLEPDLTFDLDTFQLLLARL